MSKKMRPIDVLVYIYDELGNTLKIHPSMTIMEMEETEGKIHNIYTKLEKYLEVCDESNG